MEQFLKKLKNKESLNFEETDLFPCLATFMPKLDNNNAAAVDIFKVFFPSPPVPHVSIASSDTFTCAALSLNMYTPPAISSEVSPLAEERVKKS